MGWEALGELFSDCNGGSDFFFLLISQEQRDNGFPFHRVKRGQGYWEFYIINEYILSFQEEMNFPSLKEKEEVILEAYSASQRVTMTTPSTCPYLYFYIPLIKDMGALLHFTPLAMEVLGVLNIAPSQLTLTSWALIGLSRWCARVWKSPLLLGYSTHLTPSHI